MSSGVRGIWVTTVLKPPAIPPPPPPPPLPPGPWPRTGGVSIEIGAVVSIGVGHPAGNTVQLNDEGAGQYEAEWNGGPVHLFNGVQAIDIFTKRARHNRVTINLNDPSAAPHTFEPGQTGRADASSAESAAPFSRLRITGGVAVQTGTALSITVSNPNKNTVEVLDRGAPGVEVEWNGGTAHSFTGVTTIIVRTQRAENDHITFFTSTLS